MQGLHNTLETHSKDRKKKQKGDWKEKIHIRDTNFQGLSNHLYLYSSNWLPLLTTGSSLSRKS